MTFIFANPNLPDSISQTFNSFAPVVVVDSGLSLALLLIVNSNQKYGGDTQTTELTNPDGVYPLYKVVFPFLEISKVSIENFVPAANINKLTSQRLYLDKSTLYYVTLSPPLNIKLTIELPASIPITPCELIMNVPVGFSVEQILNRGIPLNFAQQSEQLTIDCSDSCCKLRGGETLELTGLYNNQAELIGKVNVFNINQNIGTINYVEWRGMRFFEYNRDTGIKPGVFLWDSSVKVLKIIT